MPLSKEFVDALRADFPEIAVQVKASFKDEQGQQTYLTGYKPQYIIERLNDVFGHDGWDFEILKETLTDKWAYVTGKLSIYSCRYNDDQSVKAPLERVLMSSRQQIGTSKHNSYTGPGDALKGAATNALEKCASLFDIGHFAYKGLVPVPNASPHKEGQELSIAKEKLLKVCKAAKINKAAFAVLIKNVLKEDKTVDELNVEELNKLTTHVEKNGAPF